MLRKTKLQCGHVTEVRDTATATWCPFCGDVVDVTAPVAGSYPAGETMSHTSIERGPDGTDHGQAAQLGIDPGAQDPAPGLRDSPDAVHLPAPGASRMRFSTNTPTRTRTSTS